MNKEFFVFCETETQKPISIVFTMNSCLIGIENLHNHCEPEELMRHIKALNNYNKLVKFIRSLSRSGLENGLTDCEEYVIFKARELLKEIGEIE